MRTYNLWVGGGEVNEYPLNREEVLRLEEEYISNGYLDVVIEVTE